MAKPGCVSTQRLAISTQYHRFLIIFLFFFSNFHSHSSSVAAPPSLSHYRIEISRGIDDEDRLTCIRRVASTYIQYLRSRFPHPTDAKWTPFILCIEFSVKYIGANKTKEGRRNIVVFAVFVSYTMSRFATEYVWQ